MIRGREFWLNRQACSPTLRTSPSFPQTDQSRNNSMSYYTVMTVSRRSIEIEMLVCPSTLAITPRDPDEGQVRRLNRWMGILACAYRDDSLSRPAILLSLLEEPSRTYRRIGTHILFRVSPTSVVNRLSLPSRLADCKYLPCLSTGFPADSNSHCECNGGTGGGI
jgi:hypothetical protein